MALRTVTKSNSGNVVYTTKMAIGEKTEGYFMGTKTGVSKNPKWKAPLVLIFQTEDGQTVDVYASGSLNYIEENAAKDPAQTVNIGQFTVITKTGCYVNKEGKERTTFMIQQDDSKTVKSDATVSPMAAATPSTIADRLARVRQ